MPFDGRHFKELVSQISEGRFEEPIIRSNALESEGSLSYRLKNATLENPCSLLPEFSLSIDEISKCRGSFLFWPKEISFDFSIHPNLSKSLGLSPWMESKIHFSATEDPARERLMHVDDQSPPVGVLWRG
ncbi:hypothetical protein TNCV_4318031 [Trichonephila clavipes]|nr:hypothetical protein TNCV_4318031 [Trichonephila clavipes]